MAGTLEYIYSQHKANFRRTTATDCRLYYVINGNLDTRGLHPAGVCQPFRLFLSLPHKLPHISAHVLAAGRPMNGPGSGGSTLHTVVEATAFPPRFGDPSRKTPCVQASSSLLTSTWHLALRVRKGARMYPRSWMVREWCGNRLLDRAVSPSISAS